jgi:U3 small nucleolar RNA-associated protein 14
MQNPKKLQRLVYQSQRAKIKRFHFLKLHLPFVLSFSSPHFFALKESRDEESEDSESEAEQMVDGILTSASKETYEIPSQAELIQRAFAGDDVVEEFEKDKQEVLNQEVPEPEKPVLVPGWGQWTNVQKKRGLPSWMVREHEDANKKRKLDLKTRKDYRLRNVIISEKVDKKVSVSLDIPIPLFVIIPSCSHYLFLTG